MRLRIHRPGVAALAVAVAFSIGLALGRERPVLAQEKKPELPQGAEYPFLPPRYGEVHIPTEAEWRALYITALGGSRVRLTERFLRSQMTCFVTPNGLLISVDLTHQPANPAAGSGDLKPALEQALKASLAHVRGFFPELKDEHVTCRFTQDGKMLGESVGGKLTLAGAN